MGAAKHTTVIHNFQDQVSQLVGTATITRKSPREESLKLEVISDGSFDKNRFHLNFKGDKGDAKRVILFLQDVLSQLEEGGT